jgi:hypothetical protein
MSNRNEVERTKTLMDRAVDARPVRSDKTASPHRGDHRTQADSATVLATNATIQP